MAHRSGKPKYAAIKAKPGEPAHPGRGTGAKKGLMDFAGLNVQRDPFTLGTRIPENGAMIESNLNKRNTRERGPGGTSYG